MRPDQDKGALLDELETVLIQRLLALLKSDDATAADRSVSVAAQLLGKAGKLAQTGAKGSEKQNWLAMVQGMSDEEFARFQVSLVESRRAAQGGAD